MKIIKPLTLGILNRPYRYRGQNRLALAALGFFRLGSGAADRFLTENLQWAKLVPCLPFGLPLDHILPKPRAEVMLSGAAHAIGEPVKAMAVRMQCGAIDKRLCVIGDRSWHRLIGPWVCVDEAKPFARMPIAWENAYGGPDYAANPLGRGFLPHLAWLRSRAGQMPNIEAAAPPLTPGRRRYVPSCFAPMSLVHSPVRTASGSYDQRWLQEDFPGLPRDFDFGLFNLTAADQQFAGHFKGDETYCLEGLHPVHASLSGSLPGLAARAFVQRAGQGADQAEEVVLACDTVWFFPELDLAMLVYRGETPVADSDALDISSLMVAYERITDAPRTLEHYREVMALRLDTQSAGLHAFNESQLAPPRSAEVMAARAAAREQRAAAQLVRRQQLLDEQMVEFWHKSGLTPPADYVAPGVTQTALSGPSAEELAEGEFDLAELHAQAQMLADTAKRDGEARLAAGQAELQQTLTEKFPEASAVAPSVADPITSKALEQASQIAHDLVTAAPARPDPLPVALRDVLDKAEQAQPGSVTAQQQADIHATQEQAPTLRRAARNAARTPTTLTEPLPGPAAQALRELVQQCLRDGVVLAGRDLAGACLRDLDLRGADLREVQLERADLRGARFDGANLQKAVLTAACLDGADFSGAILDGANLCGTHAEGTRFCGASLRGAHAMDAVWPVADVHGAVLDDVLATGIALSGANLDDTALARSVITAAMADDSSWRNTRWHSVVALAAGFAHADFTGASLQKSVLMDAALNASNWQHAQLISVYAGGKACWEHASLRGTRFSRCGLHGANLAGADLQQGVFAQTDFGEADLSDALLSDARFYRSLFMRSRLRRVQAQRADFFQTMCRKADFSQAALQDAVLVQADTAEAIWQGADRSAVRVDRKARL
jgi:uncharacterized protein YjbI with pentapeptide repeats